MIIRGERMNKKVYTKQVRVMKSETVYDLQMVAFT